MLHGIEIILGICVFEKILNTFSTVVFVVKFLAHIIISLLAGLAVLKLSCNLIRKVKKGIKYTKTMRERQEQFNGAGHRQNAAQNRRASADLRRMKKKRNEQIFKFALNLGFCMIFSYFGIKK